MLNLKLDDNYDNIYPVKSDLDKIGTVESESFNLDAARESIILAKNDEKKILPIPKGSSKKILVTGPTGNLRKALNGGWTYTWQGDLEYLYGYGREKLTVFKALQKKTNSIVYMEGANFTDLTDLIDLTDLNSSASPLPRVSRGASI